MDVIYPVRPGDNNEELRYSLRSLAENFPHDRVVIVGSKPRWVRNVEFIDGNRGNPHANVYNNIRAAVERDDLSDRVVIFNDDFFVTEPVDAAPLAYRCTLAEHIKLPRVQRARGWWLDSLMLTRTCLQAHGIADPISYELHIPIEVDRRRMAEVLELFRYVHPQNPPQWRSLYGNLADHGGEQLKDVKCFNGSALRRPFHSTEDRSFPAFRAALHKLFPDPSPYEAA
ncbi:hypothetical protein SEA_REPTAR3000_6 [Mycobacterium phage Reptar3000]|nr:hypothetical protein SEA_REPTAR3000_6 [Mycobacterium phage Reptar3000]